MALTTSTRLLEHLRNPAQMTCSGGLGTVGASEQSCNGSVLDTYSSNM